MSTEHVAQAIEVEGLGQVFAGAELDRLDGAVDRGVRGHENHFAARHVGADLPQQIEAVHVGHAQIDHREIGGLAHQHPHRLGAAGAGVDLEPGLGREALDDLEYRQFVVDDQERRPRSDERGDNLRYRHNNGCGPAAGATRLRRLQSSTPVSLRSVHACRLELPGPGCPRTMPAAELHEPLENPARSAYDPGGTQAGPPECAPLAVGACASVRNCTPAGRPLTVA